MATNLISPLLFQSTPFGDRDAFLDFIHQHWLWHGALARATKTAWLALDDLRLNVTQDATMHRLVAKALNLAPADLSDYDLRDRDSYLGYMQQVSLDTQRLRVAAGL